MSVGLAMQMSQQLKNARTGVRGMQAVTWLLHTRRSIAQARNPSRATRLHVLTANGPVRADIVAETEIRDREKVMRGLKKPETPIIPGYQIYHNYLRPHEALEGKTPADACGIEVQCENMGITLIQDASSVCQSPSR